MGRYQPTIAAEITPYTRLAGDSTLHAHPDTAVVGCPQGDADQLVVKVAIDPSVVVGPIPKSALTLNTPDGDAIFYATVEADSNATLDDGKYRTTLTASQLGGCWADAVCVDTVTVSLDGNIIGSAIVDVRSPDLVTDPDSYGHVEIADFGKYGEFHGAPPKPYNCRADYRPPGGDNEVELADFGFFGLHWDHSTSGSGEAPVQFLPSDGVVRLELAEDATLIGPRKLVASVILENVEPFEVMVIAFRNGNPDLMYAGWTQDPEYAGQTMCAEILKDGEKQVFLGVIGSTKSTKSNFALGNIEFHVNTEDRIENPENDISLVLAELLEVDGKKRQLTGTQFSSSSPEPAYQYKLAQNYPNPFNPSTTIAYSIASASDVTLAIFDVRGKLVRTLVSGRKTPNNYRVTWDGTDNRNVSVASGVYFYRLTTGEFAATKKMVLLR
jgi:hypothetical protein